MRSLAIFQRSKESYSNYNDYCDDDDDDISFLSTATESQINDMII